MATLTIKSFWAGSGYGFATTKDFNEDIFIHAGDLPGGRARPGQVIQAQVVMGSKGLKAKDIAVTPADLVRMAALDKSVSHYGLACTNQHLNEGTAGWCGKCGCHGRDHQLDILIRTTMGWVWATEHTSYGGDGQIDFWLYPMNEEDWTILNERGYLSLPPSYVEHAWHFATVWFSDCWCKDKDTTVEWTDIEIRDADREK